MKVFRGTIIHAPKFGELDVIEDGMIGIGADGNICFVSPADKVEIQFSNDIVEHLGDRVLIPGFVDTHCHAPQYVFAGKKHTDRITFSPRL